jgi:SOS-response transcriptional repressor LexA
MPNDWSIGASIQLPPCAPAADTLGVPISKNYGKLIEATRERKKMSQAMLAKAAGISQPSLSAIESGETQVAQVKLDTMWKIAAALGVPLGTIVSEDSVDYNIERAPPFRSRVPLVARVPAGPPLESAPGNILDYLEFGSKSSPLAYALQVKGDSMVRPDGTGFPEGCYILVEPRRRPKSGDFVVARFVDTDEETFKQFVLDGQVKLLRSLNPTYTTKHVLGPGSEILGTVIEKQIIERF